MSESRKEKSGKTCPSEGRKEKPTAGSFRNQLMENGHRGGKRPLVRHRFPTKRAVKRGRKGQKICCKGEMVEKALILHRAVQSMMSNSSERRSKRVSSPATSPTAPASKTITARRSRSARPKPTASPSSATSSAKASPSARAQIDRTTLLLAAVLLAAISVVPAASLPDPASRLRENESAFLTFRDAGPRDQYRVDPGLFEAVFSQLWGRGSGSGSGGGRNGERMRRNQQSAAHGNSGSGRNTW